MPTVDVLVCCDCVAPIDDLVIQCVSCRRDLHEQCWLDGLPGLQYERLMDPELVDDWDSGVSVLCHTCRTLARLAAAPLPTLDAPDR